MSEENPRPFLGRHVVMIGQYALEAEAGGALSLTALSLLKPCVNCSRLLTESEKRTVIAYHISDETPIGGIVEMAMLTLGNAPSAISQIYDIEGDKKS